MKATGFDASALMATIMADEFCRRRQEIEAVPCHGPVSHLQEEMLAQLDAGSDAFYVAWSEYRAGHGVTA